MLVVKAEDLKVRDVIRVQCQNTKCKCIGRIKRIADNHLDFGEATGCYGVNHINRKKFWLIGRDVDELRYSRKTEEIHINETIQIAEPPGFAPGPPRGLGRGGLVGNEQRIDEWHERIQRIIDEAPPPRWTPFDPE